MDPIEKAIRSAFEKGNAEDKAFRESIYRKAFAALDRALQANPNLTVEAAISRRKVLQAKIVEIETEFVPAAARPVPAFEARQEPGTASPIAPEVRVDAQAPSRTEFVPAAGRPVPAATDPLAGAFEVRMEPGAAAPIAPEVRVDEQAPSRQPGLPGDLGGLDVAADRPTAPIFTGPLDTASEVQPDPDAARSRRRRRPFAIFFIVATLLALLGMGLLFAYQTGLFLSPSERDTSVPNPPGNGESEDFIPENEEPPVLSSEPEAQRDWISIFAPDAASSVSAPTGTTAEAKQDESGSFIRIRSGDSGAAVVFDVGQDVLERIAGKKATFDINARAADGEDTEMAVDCDFGELGDCGRKRYALGYERADFLFELDMPAAQPGAGGSIAIVSDFANSGKSVDIYEIKVSVAP